MNQIVSELVIDARSAVAGSAQYVRAMAESQAALEQLKAREGAAVQASAASWRLLGRDVPISASAIERALTRVEASLDPILRKQLQLEREMIRSTAAVERAVLTGARTEEQATDMLSRLRARQIADLERVRAAAAGRPLDHGQVLAGAANENWRRQGLGYQLFDVSQGIALGAPMAMVAMQQGPQILQMYAGQGGINAALKDTASLLGGVARAAGPWIAAAGAIYTAYRWIGSYSAEAALSIDSATAALAAQAAPIGSVQSGIEQLANLQRTYRDAISTTADVQDAATQRIIANTKREFEAKKALLELESIRQEAALKAADAEIAKQGLLLRQGIAGGTGGTGPYGLFFSPNNGVNTRTDLERQGFADPRINGGIPFVRLPDEISGLERLQEVIDKSPVAMKLRELRAEGELARVTFERLQEALKSTFEGGELLPGGAFGAPAGGRPIPLPTFRGIDDEPGEETFMRDFRRASEIRVRQLEAERDAIGLAGGSLEAFRFKQEALLDAYRQNLELTPAMVAEIDKAAAAYAALADAAAPAALTSELTFRENL